MCCVALRQINYPYLTNHANGVAASSCHQYDMKYSVYNTLGELSDRCVEYFAMQSLGMLLPGEGGGADWLQEHLRDGYSPAWSNPVSSATGTPAVPNPAPLEGARLQDAGIAIGAMTRFNNYYLQGLQQMQRDFGLNGIYLDGISYDRITLMRARMILGDDSTIDHHGAQWPAQGFSPAMNYMEHYAFIDRLWYGEGFNYDNPSADFWLTEIAAVQTGLSADMLRYTSTQNEHGLTRYHYRGMLVGSAFRGPAFGGPLDSRGTWSLWDEFGIADATMIGWWEDIECGHGTVPVVVSHPEFKATVYLHHGVKALVVIAWWGGGDEPAEVSLTYDWAAMGLDPPASVHVPVLAPYQLAPLAGDYPPSQAFNVSAAQGGLVVIVQ